MKYMLSDMISDFMKSPLVRGEWIEIFELSKIDASIELSPLVRGEWIEIEMVELLKALGRSLPL